MPDQQEDDIQVILSYRKLEQLLNAAGEVRQLRNEVKRLSDQQAALRYQFTELLEQLENLS